MSACTEYSVDHMVSADAEISFTGCSAVHVRHRLQNTVMWSRTTNQISLFICLETPLPVSFIHGLRDLEEQVGSKGYAQNNHSGGLNKDQKFWRFHIQKCRDSDVQSPVGFARLPLNFRAPIHFTNLISFCLYFSALPPPPGVDNADTNFFNLNQGPSSLPPLPGGPPGMLPRGPPPRLPPPPMHMGGPHGRPPPPGGKLTVSCVSLTAKFTQ